MYGSRVARYNRGARQRSQVDGQAAWLNRDRPRVGSKVVAGQASRRQRGRRGCDEAPIVGVEALIRKAGIRSGVVANETDVDLFAAGIELDDNGRIAAVGSDENLGVGQLAAIGRIGRLDVSDLP